MIRLHRRELHASTARALRRRAEMVRAGADARSIVLPDGVRKTLRASQHDKCAYCEVKVGSSGFMRVDHHRPRSRYEGLVAAWTNLVGCCEACNGAKGDRFDEEAPLVDPYVDDPTRHLAWDRHDVRGTSPCGTATVATLGLARIKLVESRAELYRLMRALIDHGGEDGLRMVQDCAGTSREFCAMTRQLLLDRPGEHRRRRAEDGPAAPASERAAREGDL